MAGSGVSDRDLRRVVAASMIGATIEWYDFFLYGTVAGIVFNKLYFPAKDPLISILLAYTTFAIGFVARPIGGLIFGHFGDRLGRKNMLVLTLMIMGVATVLIGVLPTYQQIGTAAPILLLLLRILQGIGLGGEWGGAVTMTYEYASEDKRGLYASLPQIGLSIGLALSAGVVALASTLPEDQFLAWGWRVGFLISVVLVAVGLYIRLRIMETLGIHQAQGEGPGSANSFRQHDQGISAQHPARHGRALHRRRVLQRVRRVQHRLSGEHGAHQPHDGALGRLRFGTGDDRVHPDLRQPVGQVGQGQNLRHWFGLARAIGLSCVLDDERRQYRGDLSRHDRSVRHHLRDVLRAGGGVVLRSVRSAGALHRHLVRLSILRNLRERHHPDHRNVSGRRKRQPALVSMRLRGVRCADQCGLRRRHQRHDVATGGADNAAARGGVKLRDTLAEAALSGRLCFLASTRNVRYWDKADAREAPINVRCWDKSGHRN